MCRLAARMNAGNTVRNDAGYTLSMSINASLSRAPRQRVPSCITDVSVRSRVWLEVRGEFAIGQGGIDLLVRIQQRGSLARAARDLGWSYRHAWGYVRRAERILQVGLITTRTAKGQLAARR
jgi:hypothetical protein